MASEISERSDMQPDAATEPLASSVLLYPRRSFRSFVVRLRLFITRPYALEIWFWAFCIFLLTTPFTFQLMGENPVDHVSRNMNTMRRADFSQFYIYLVRMFVFAAAVFFALPRWRLTIRSLHLIAPILAFLGWIWASVLWSDSFATTLNSAASLTMLILAGFLIGVRLPAPYAAKALMGSAFLMAIASLAVSLTMPTYGVHQATDAAQSVHAGAWRGVYLHKNHFGQLCGSYLAAVLCCGRQIIRPFAKWTLAAVLVFLIVRSTSASAIVLVPLSLSLTCYIVVFNPMEKAFGTVAALAGGLITTLSFSLVLQALGRDPTLSGRTNIWESAFDFISRSPVYGYGYNSSSYGGFVLELNRLTGLADPHDGYIDLTLGTGAIGLTLFLITVIACGMIARGVYRSGGAYGNAALVMNAMINGFLISTITEANIRPFGAIGGIGMCAIAMSLSLPRTRRFTNRRALPAPAPADPGDGDGSPPPILPFARR
ncbi:O-antigen ligase family protein [Sphingobium amiense]|uniref:O-antigen ligase family protein n=1 Tax=Sphingobium amiense TaxID=135719 RepID=A0A494W642_9SPHN|nr:O-antigen ligase family protein [Sphingobium amiense]BBD99721.1 O-antigen ligase family protein [Sphingobium amiense]